MVSFHRIPYAEVYKRGEKQFEALDTMLNVFDNLSEINEETVRKYIT
jgi:hypothetical protein